MAWLRRRDLNSQAFAGSTLVRQTECAWRHRLINAYPRLVSGHHSEEMRIPVDEFCLQSECDIVPRELRQCQQSPDAEDFDLLLRAKLTSKATSIVEQHLKRMSFPPVMQVELADHRSQLRRNRPLRRVRHNMPDAVGAARW